MSIAQGRYEHGMPVRFCTDGVELSAHSKPRSAASMPSIAAEASGKRATPNSEARLTRKRKKVNFDDPATTSSSRPSRQPGSVSCRTSPVLMTTIFNPIVESTTGSSGRLMERPGCDPRQSSARMPRKGSRRSGK